MQRKKILIIAVTVVLIPIFLLIFIFSKPGNDMLIKPYVQSMLDEKVKIPARIQELRISWSAFAILITLEDDSTIKAEGSYSLFAQSIDGTYHVSLKELANLQKLTGQKLYGPLNIQGSVQGNADNLHTQGNTDLFKSDTTYDITLIDQKPGNASIVMKDGQLAQALHMLGQPAFSKGLLHLQADLKAKDDNEALGDITLKTTQGILNAKLLKEKQGIELPGDVSFRLNMLSHIDGDQTTSNANLDSDILLAKISDAQFNTGTEAIDLNYLLKVQNVLLPEINLKEPVELTGQVKGELNDMVVQAHTGIFESNSNVKLALEKFQPANVNYDLKNINIDKVLNLLKQPKYLSGKINAKGDITNLDPKALKGTANITSTDSVLNAKVLNKEMGMKLTEDLPFILKSDTRLDGNQINAKTTLKSSLANLSMKKTVFNAETQHLSSDYQLNLPDLSNLEPLIGQKLVGRLDINGEIKKAETLFASAKSHTLGGSVDLKFDDTKIDLHTKNLQVTELVKMLNQPSLVTEGSMQLDAKLDMAGKNTDMMQNLSGPVNFYASGLTVKNYDVDKIIEQFNKSKKVDLIDIGAFALAGPLGGLLTKGLDAGGMAGGFSEGATSVIKEIRADVDIQKGLANARDIALATKKHRIAVQGGIDLPTKAFKEFSVATLTKEGCVDFRQNIRGTTDKPEFSTMEAATGVVGSLLGSVLDPVANIAGVKCTPYYTGKVEHPQ